jgi:hypothetical protein
MPQQSLWSACGAVMEIACVLSCVCSGSVACICALSAARVLSAGVVVFAGTALAGLLKGVSSLWAVAGAVAVAPVGFREEDEAVLAIGSPLSAA